MPVSLIQATAEEAADNFRQEIGAVLSGLASALGTPYPSTIVTDEADARKYVPGSIFLLKDGTYAWSALSSAVRKESANPRPDIYLVPFGQKSAKKWTTVQLDGLVDRVAFGCLVTGPNQAAQGFGAGYNATGHVDSSGTGFLLYVPQQNEGVNQLASAYGINDIRLHPLEEALERAGIKWSLWRIHPLDLEQFDDSLFFDTTDAALRDAVVAFGRAHASTHNAEQIDEAFRNGGAARYIDDATRRIHSVWRLLGLAAPSLGDIAAICCGIAELPDFASTLAFALQPSQDKDFPAMTDRRAVHLYGADAPPVARRCGGRAAGTREWRRRADTDRGGRDGVTVYFGGGSAAAPAATAPAARAAVAGRDRHGRGSRRSRGDRDSGCGGRRPRKSGLGQAAVVELYR